MPCQSYGGASSLEAQAGQNRRSFPSLACRRVELESGLEHMSSSPTADFSAVSLWK